MGAVDLKKVGFPIAALFAQCDNPIFNTARLQRQVAGFRGVPVFAGKSHITLASPSDVPASYPVLVSRFFAGPGRDLAEGLGASGEYSVVKN